MDKARTAEELIPLFGHDLADHPASEGQQLAAMRAEDCTAELSQLAGIPTLVVSGQHDPISPPAVGQRLAAGIPGARFLLLPDQAHGAPILAAREVNAGLADHLRAAEAPRTPAPA